VRPLAAEDDRAALVLVATGRAFAVTADPELGAPGVERRSVAGAPLPLRLHVVWRAAGLETAAQDAVQRALDADTATSDTAAAFRVLTSNDAAPRVRAYDPALGSATTARDMTRLLAAVWTDRAASSQQCRFARELLGAQVWPHRLRSGFPYAGVTVAGKTGTLGAVRNEVGVVQFDGEHPVAVAVFTRAARADAVLPRADSVIGRTARLAVTDLRSGRL
jgi:beta-lactamase class A